MKKANEILCVLLLLFFIFSLGNGVGANYFNYKGALVLILILISVVKIEQFCLAKFDYGAEGKKIPKDVEYFTDIPCRKNIFRAYYIGHKYKLIKSKTDILGAILLKWLKDGIIEIKEKEHGLMFKKENVIIVIKELYPELEPKEKELYQMLCFASGDKYLESKEFEKWCKYSKYKIHSWFKKIINAEEKN